ncbi:hypothetical protein [Burkholderia oklahomensis]|uniref:hypothetical protein n=1 Tax=Burkholderia oklahomensis TaxID=342113 RepID=UPI001E64BFEA|nr:hypothetical protein [Burkholderia oklahomensis]MDN7671926.1 hypothetical protein [Burkholderia oklahomensis]
MNSNTPHGARKPSWPKKIRRKRLPWRVADVDVDVDAPPDCAGEFEWIGSKRTPGRG